MTETLINHGHHMQTAIRTAEYSIDPSVQNGAVIIDGHGMVIGAGCNEFPDGVGVELPERWERPAKYMWIEHAERNAIYNAAFLGNATVGATMYCPWASCADCARAIVQAGIIQLVRFPMPPADGWNESIQTGDMILDEAGVEIIEISMDGIAIPEGLRLGQFRS